MSDLPARLARPCPWCGHHTLYKPEGWTEGGPVACANPGCDSNHPPEPFTTADVRRWLRDQGYDVPTNGRVPDSLIEEFLTAWRSASPPGRP